MSLAQKRDAAAELLLDYLVEKIEEKSAGGSDCANLIKLLDKLGYEYAPETPQEEQLIDGMVDDPIHDPLAAYDQ